MANLYQKLPIFNDFGGCHNSKAAAVKFCVRQHIWDSFPMPNLVIGLIA